MKKLIFFFALLLITLSANAQQYGHLNFGELLSLMPQTEAAEQKLQAYNDSLVASGQTMATNAQQLIEDYQRAVTSREESPRQIAAREQAIRDAQETLSGFEYQAQQLLNDRRAKLLEPVVTMANEAVSTLAKEKGLILVFDTSIFNAVLFADDTLDLMPLMKERLGLE